MLYKVNTNNCYDSVIEQNLNTGLPKMISCITSKHIMGKPPAKKQDVHESKRKPEAEPVPFGMPEELEGPEKHSAEDRANPKDKQNPTD